MTKKDSRNTRSGEILYHKINFISIIEKTKSDFIFASNLSNKHGGSENLKILQSTH